MSESLSDLAWIRRCLSPPLATPRDSSLIATSLEGDIAFWDAGAEQIYGWSSEQALGRNILDVTPATYTREDSSVIMDRLQRGDSWAGEILLRRRDGRPLLAYVLDVPILGSATHRGAIIGLSVRAEHQDRIASATATLEQAIRSRFVAA